MSARRYLLVAATVMVLTGCVSPDAQEAETGKPVGPNLNKKFVEAKDVQPFVDAFEGEDRQVFKHRERIMELLELEPGMAVADVGAGTGFYTIMFADKVGPQGRAYGIDIAPRFLEHIQTQAVAHGLTNVITVQCRDDSVELPDESIDRAFICDTYHHFEHPKSTMRSLCRAMKPGGEVVVVEFCRSEDKLKDLPPERREWIRKHVRGDRDEFTREIEACGFEPVPHQPQTPYLTESYVLRFCKAD